MKNRIKFISHMALLSLLLWSLTGPLRAVKAEDTEQKVVRVGWYEYDGFYMIDKDGYRSGYGYDYLQEIARRTGWQYEYVCGTVMECMEMLRNHEIDLLGSVMYSEERDEYVDFSDLNMGRNYSVITTLATNLDYEIGDYGGMDGIHIGILAGDLRKLELEWLAEERGFTYRLTEYDTTAQVEQALQAGEVEAMLSTNMRVARGDEKMIAQFAPVDFYFVTSEGNSSVLQALNSAMEEIEYSRKGFQAELSQKYFSVDMSGSLVFTREELEYIEQNPVLQVAFLTSRRPLAYEENGECKGFVVDIMDAISDKIGISFEYTLEDLSAEGIRKILDGNVDMIAGVYDDYGWAEKNGIFQSAPYLNLDYVLVGRSGEPAQDGTAIVAAVEGFRFSEEYVESRYPAEQIRWYQDEKECIDAVRRGQADICYVCSYVASGQLSRYKYRNLYTARISYSHGLSIGTSAENRLLVSVLDKAIASMGANEISRLVDENMITQERNLTFFEITMRYPIQFIGIIGSFLLIVLVLLAVLMITRNNRRKNEEIYHVRLAAEHDALTGLYNRPAFEAIVNEELQKNVDKPKGIFVMLDIDKFKQINDTRGHRYGDMILSSLARGLHLLFDPFDAIICRMGGDEFAMFFPDPPDSEAVETLLREGQKELMKGFLDVEPVSCSFGAVAVSEDHCDFSTLYEMADQSLYCAKHDGGGCVHIRTEG